MGGSRRRGPRSSIGQYGVAGSPGITGATRHPTGGLNGGDAIAFITNHLRQMYNIFNTFPSGRSTDICNKGAPEYLAVNS